MANKTLDQRLRDARLDEQAEGSLRDAALAAWAVEVEERRAKIASLLKRKLRRGPDVFPEPLKGRIVVAEVEGFLFGYLDPTDRLAEDIGLMVICPVCDEPMAYSFRGYAQLGTLIANAEIDRRCTHCIKANRREF